jgi:hypothetical protein
MISITPENLHDFPVGTVVESHYGAYFAPVEGRVVGHEILAASKWFPASARLIIEEENGNKTTVTRLSDPAIDKGIGTYLIELAETAPSVTKSKSPWSVA